MEGLKLIPYIALIIAISGIVIGASAIVLSKFGETIDVCYNASYNYNATLNQCNNETVSPLQESAGQEGLNFSDEYYTIYKSQEGNTTIAEQIPTVAIIGVMVIIISIIAGVFVYMKYFA